MILNKTIIKSNYTVTVELKLLKYSERLKLLKELKVTGVDGNIEADAINQTEGLIELTKKQVISIKIKTEDKEYNSLDDLEYFAEYQDIMNELMVIVVKGAKMGEV
jgi:hypothetical protein